MQSLNFDSIRPYVEIARLHRPIGIYLLLWPTLWALWLAEEGTPRIALLVVFVLGTVLMRSAGCVINDIADRDFDSQVKRTAQRPLATGQLSTRNALIFFVVLLLASAQLLLFLNRFTVLLSFIGVALAVLYPFTKRFTHIPQVFLGLAFGWAVPMAFAATREAIPNIAWITYIAALLLAVIYDTEYAMVDRKDDMKAGIKSTAILFGDLDLLAILVLQVLFVITLITIGIKADLQWPYWLAIGGTVALFYRQQTLIADRDEQGCFAAFKNNNWVGLLVFFGIAGSYLLSAQTSV